MHTRNIQSLPSQLIAKQKKTICLKQCQLSQKFKWLSKYLTSEYDQNFDQQNIIAKSIKFHPKANNRKINNRVLTQTNCWLTKKYEVVKSTNMQIFCADSMKQNMRPLTSQKHIRQKSLVIQPVKVDKMRGRSFLLHNFNSTNMIKFYNRKSSLNKTVVKKKKTEEITNKAKNIIEEKFLLSPWDVKFAEKQNNENNYLIDQIALL